MLLDFKVFDWIPKKRYSDILHYVDVDRGVVIVASAVRERVSSVTGVLTYRKIRGISGLKLTMIGVFNNMSCQVVMYLRQCRRERE